MTVLLRVPVGDRDSRSQAGLAVKEHIFIWSTFSNTPMLNLFLSVYIDQTDMTAGKNVISNYRW